MIVDLIVLVLVLLGAFAGYRKGLVGILVSLIGLIIAIALAFMLQAPVANALNENTGIGQTIHQSVKKGIKEAVLQENENTTETTEKKVEKNHFYQDLIQNATTEEQIDNAANSVTLFLLKGISFIGVFIVVMIIFYILQMLLNLVFNLPILDTLNKVGGIAAGALKSVIGIWIILAVISFLSPISTMNSVVSYIHSSTLTSFLYSHNLFVTLILATLK